MGVTIVKLLLGRRSRFGKLHVKD